MAIELSATLRGFIRGGNWNNGSNAGVLTLNLNNAPSNSNTNIGFRVSRYKLNGPIQQNIITLLPVPNLYDSFASLVLNTRQIHQKNTRYYSRVFLFIA